MNGVVSKASSALPVPPTDVLPDETNGHCSLVWIQLGHVEVINKVNQMLCSWWSIVHSSLLLEWRLEHLTASMMFQI